jgi:iron(III) transport system substrate-binding protein
MNFEYPVNSSVLLSEELNSWGEFKEDKLPVERLAELAPTAQKIIDRVGW